MLKKITISASGQSAPLVKDGNLVLLKETTFSTIGILRTESKVEIENLFDLTAKHLELLNISQNGVYLLSISALKKLQMYDSALNIQRNINTIEEDEGEFVFLLDEGMLVIGRRRKIGTRPTISSIPELAPYRKSVYTFLEASFPEDVEAEQQFLYNCPSFFAVVFKKAL
jgi:hypothetical protein